jgi:hypothetical protein
VTVRVSYKNVYLLRALMGVLRRMMGVRNRK